METDFSGTSGKVEFVKFMEGLKDMEYGGTRNEARRTIGDILGCKIFISGMESTKRTMAKDKLNEIESKGREVEVRF